MLMTTFEIGVLYFFARESDTVPVVAPLIFVGLGSSPKDGGASNAVVPTRTVAAALTSRKAAVKSGANVGVLLAEAAADVVEPVELDADTEVATPVGVTLVDPLVVELPLGLLVVGGVELWFEAVPLGPALADGCVLGFGAATSRRGSARAAAYAPAAARTPAVDPTGTATTVVALVQPLRMTAMDIAAGVAADTRSIAEIPRLLKALAAAFNLPVLAITIARVMVPASNAAADAVGSPDSSASTNRALSLRAITAAVTAFASSSVAELATTTILAVVSDVAATAWVTLPTSAMRQTASHGPGGLAAVASMSMTSEVDHGTAPESVTPDNATV